MYQFIIETGAYMPDITLICLNENNEKIDEVKISGKIGELVVKTNGSYTVIATDSDGDYGEDSKTITKCKIETYTTTPVIADAGKNSKTVMDSENHTVEVPAGFYYGTSSNVGKISTGFVITDSVDESGNSTGNEFVWIPVDKETLKVIDANGELTDKVIAKESTGDYAGIDSNGNTNYEGVLYDFTKTTSSERTNYGQNTDYDPREPGLVTDYDNDTSKPDGSEQTYLEQIGLTAETFKIEMQENYNAMIKSIQTYGGFYVARYEMGVKDGTIVISKLGVTLADKKNEIARYWYGLYSKAKTYTTNSVQSSMIWGSLYDAMLNFASTGPDKLKTEVYSNKIDNLAIKTGTYVDSDSIINIYDLEIDIMTLEAHWHNLRSVRSGRRHSGGDVVEYPGEEGHNQFGTRAILYIK